MMEIAQKTGYSNSGVKYLADKYNIKRRSRSEANYLKYNPTGDPFKVKKLKSKRDIELFNLGIGLFLGEGCKKTRNHVVLANTNPEIIKLFLEFLRNICGVENHKIKAALNIYDDVNIYKALTFWQTETKIPLIQFYKPIIRKSRGGTYKDKSKYGTLAISISNTKLKTIIDEQCNKALRNYL